MKRQNKTSRSLLSFLMIMAIALLASCSGNTPESPAKADTKPETETVRLAVFQQTATATTPVIGKETLLYSANQQRKTFNTLLSNPHSIVTFE